MSVWMVRLRRLHNFCMDQLVYPLVLASLLACVLYYGRTVVAHRSTFSFLMWNLFLAWIPYLCGLFITLVHKRRPGAWWLLVLPGVLWLIFLPNAPYIVTDLWHLDNRPPTPIWYDIGMLATFAWAGCFLGIVSLSQMQHVVRAYYGRLVSWLFVLGTLGLTGLGIYLGRFLKLNSWDIILHPSSTLSDIVDQLVHPFSYPRPFGVTLLFAAFMLICYLTFVAIEHRQYAYRETE